MKSNKSDEIRPEEEKTETKSEKVINQQKPHLNPKLKDNVDAQMQRSTEDDEDFPTTEIKPLASITEQSKISNLSSYISKSSQADNKKS